MTFVWIYRLHWGSTPLCDETEQENLPQFVNNAYWNYSYVFLVNCYVNRNHVTLMKPLGWSSFIRKYKSCRPADHRTTDFPKHSTSGQVTDRLSLLCKRGRVAILPNTAKQWRGLRNLPRSPAIENLVAWTNYCSCWPRLPGGDYKLPVWFTFVPVYCYSSCKGYSNVKVI